VNLWSSDPGFSSWPLIFLFFCSQYYPVTEEIWEFLYPGTTARTQVEFKVTEPKMGSSQPNHHRIPTSIRIPNRMGTGAYSGSTPEPSKYIINNKISKSKIYFY
jgi:hypothetical protein